MLRSKARRPAPVLAAAGFLLALGLLVAGYLLTAGPPAPFGVWQSVGRVLGTRQDLQPPGFQDLTRRGSATDGLVCPPDYCPRAKVDAESPVFTISAERLAAKLRRVALEEPRTVELASPAAGRLRFVQTSLILGLPDVIDVQVIPRSSGSSTVALYSRGALGQLDFGGNEGRLARWMDALSQ